MTMTGHKLTLPEVDCRLPRGPLGTTYPALSEVSPGRVRVAAGLDLVGWDELVLLVFAVCWLPGAVLGAWLGAVLLGAVQ